MIERLSEYFNVAKRIRQYKLLAKNAALNDKVVCINAARTIIVPFVVEIFLALCYRAQGATVYVLIDDGVLNTWDTVRFRGKLSLTPYRGALKHRIKWLPSLLVITVLKRCASCAGLIFVKYSEIKKSDETFTPKIREDSHVSSSEFRFWEVSCKSEVPCNSLRARLLEDAHFGRKLGAYIDQRIKPELFFTSHAIYATWGPCFDYLKGQNIKCFVWSMNPYRAQRVKIADKILQFESSSSAWLEYDRMSQPLVDREIIRKTLDQRLAHQSADSKIYFPSESGVSSLEGPPKSTNRWVFGAFPNLVWDGSLPERNIVFDGIVDWLVQTVQLVLRYGHVLYIRLHPAEATMFQDSRSLLDLLETRMPGILNEDSVRVIEPHEKIDTHSLVKERIDIGLVYDGTLAFELPYLGVPAVVCGRSRVSGTGVAFEISNPDEYQGIFADPQLIVERFRASNEEILDRVFKYGFWFFEGSSVDIPILSTNIPGALQAAKDKATRADLRKVSRRLEELVGYL